MPVNPSPKVFGGPLDASDRDPPLYWFDRAGRPYVLLAEVGAMVERMTGLPARRRPQDPMDGPRTAPAQGERG